MDGKPARSRSRSAPNAASPAAMPEPIYWKQHLFLIPYQWGSAAEPGAAQVVWLLVSKDRGTTWQKISEAKPEVKAFNYRAGADGEYWFAVRTIDKQGRAWPPGPYQPELRVIVDTTLPQIDELREKLAENGIIEIHARATDLNLDPKSWKLEWQPDPNAAWQAVALQGAGSRPEGSVLHGYWQPPAGSRPTAIRGTVWDRAGNSSTYQIRFETGSIASGPLLAAPIVTSTPASPNLPLQTADSPPMTMGPANAPMASSVPGAPAVVPPTHAATVPASQQWPATAVAGAPFRLWTSGTEKTDDGVTAYGSPPLFNTPLIAGDRSNINTSEPRIEAHYAGLTKPPADAVNGASPAPSIPPQFTTLEPYRESAAALAAEQAAAVPSAHNGLSPIDKSNARDVTPVDSSAASHTPTSPPKLVGSRTFALEYDLVNAGSRPVSKVELWGTRDGGQSWSRYGRIMITAVQSS